MTSAVLNLPPFVRRRLADALESGLLSPPFTSIAIRAAIGRLDLPEDLLGVLQMWEREGVSGRVAAAWIRSLEEAASSVAPASLVWTGPPAKGLHSRRTRQVFEELVRGSARSLWISSFTYFNGPDAFSLLAWRMERLPDLEVTLLLNIMRRTRRSVPREQLVRDYSNRFWTEDWPSTVRPRVFYDPRSLDPGRRKGVLHAKAVVSDEERLFVTSANLTEAAMDRNIEIGLLLRDPALARTAVAHFRGLIERDLLLPLPPPE